MNTEIQERPTNKTPMIYTGGDFITPYPKTEEFIKELADLYNKYGIDSRLNMRDFLLAEMSYNFLAVMHNTMRMENKMRDDTNEGQALLYAVEKTAERTKREMIEKVVEWMRNFKDGQGNFPLYDYVGNLKQAMQDESK
jgi:hypothetical protein